MRDQAGCFENRLNSSGRVVRKHAAFVPARQKRLGSRLRSPLPSVEEPCLLSLSHGFLTTLPSLRNAKPVCFRSIQPGLMSASVDFREWISYHSYFKKEKKMAYHHSAVRQWKRSLRKAEVNKKSKSALRSQVKKLRDAIEKKDLDAAQEILPKTFAAIDKSVKKGTIHQNKGNRYKSRLSRQVGLITTPSTPSK